MSKFDPTVYLRILSVHQAYAFDLGCILMRIYMYMGTIGIVSMLTLSGHSALFAGTVSSMLAISTFFISPRTGKFMDELGQRRVVAITSSITLCGVALLLLTVAFGWPQWLTYLAAFFMGFVPSAPAIARTRWTYLSETGQLGQNAPALKSIYSYEGVLEDFAFMIGPAGSIALSSLLFPTAGILLGGLLFATGTLILLTFGKDTEPQVGWKKHDDQAVDSPATKRRIALVELPIVHVLFCFTLLVGFFYGAFDTTSIVFAQSLGDPNVASMGLSVGSLISMLASFGFGCMVLKSGLDKQVFVGAVLISLSYMGMAFITNAPAFYAVSWFGAIFYPPCIIAINAYCESVVPADRLTESLTWVSAGITCGLALSPTVTGAILDAFGPTAGFIMGAIACLALLLLAVACKSLLTKAAQH